MVKKKKPKEATNMFKRFMLILLLFVMVGCAGLSGNRVVPKTPGEQLAYAEATLTGLTLASISLNDARMIPLEKAKELEVIITKAELSLKMGRLALVAHNADGALEQLYVVQNILVELTSFVEGKRVDYSNRPLPIHGDPVPIPEPDVAGGDL
jgi:hypothetical protein